MADRNGSCLYSDIRNAYLAFVAQNENVIAYRIYTNQMTIELLDEVVNYSPDHLVFVKGKMDADNVVKWTEKYEICSDPNEF